MDLVITVRSPRAYAGGSRRAPRGHPSEETEVGEATDVRIRARVPVTAGDLRRHLSGLVHGPIAALAVAGRALPDSTPVGRPPLVHGAEVLILSDDEGTTAPDGSTTRAGTGRRGDDAVHGIPSPGPSAAGHQRAPAARWGVADLAVISGPDCGRRLPITARGVDIGRAGATATTVAVDDPGASRRHARVRATAAGLLLEDVGSTNGTIVDGREITEGGVTIDTTSRITLGRSRIRLLSPPPPAATWGADGHGHLVANPAARRPAPRPVRRFRMPAPPTSEPASPPPWLTMLVPLPIALALGWFFGPQLLLFAALGPLMMGASWWQERRRHRRREAVRTADHDVARRELAAAVQAALDSERSDLEADLPHAVTVLDAATSRTAPLWSRRPGERTFGLLRLGLADVPSSTVSVHPVATAAEAPGTDAEPEVAQAPLGVSWAAGLVISGDVQLRTRVLRHLIGQAAVLHSPTDLALVVVPDADSDADSDAAAAAEADADDTAAPDADVDVDVDVEGATQTEDSWAWTRWLPHSEVWEQAASSEGTIRAGRLRARLLRELDRRQGCHPHTGPRGDGVPTGGAARPPHLLVIVPPGSSHQWAGWSRLFEEGPALGVSIIWAADALPPSAGQAHRLTVTDDGSGALATTEGTTARVFEVDVDGVGQWWVDRLSRSLAPLRPLSLPMAGTQTSSDLWSLHGLPRPGVQDGISAVDDPSAATVAHRWTEALACSGAPRPVARIGGSGTDGFSIDLASDGPHLLLGGTTGSGKSEFLRTLVLGMAADAPPCAVTFLLLDYKGGAAFGRCAELPHVVGLITDLDDSLAKRALVSLRAEIRRREGLLAAHGVDDLDGYWRLPPTARSEELPRLVIVIDEFRVLAQEVPDFLAGVVHCAAVGRSLGIHLVLATQRPAGVISADIQSNVNLRIALRLRDAADSEQVIGSPVAAAVDPDQPGTGFMRDGSGTLTPFRAIRVSGPLTPTPPPVLIERLSAVLPAPSVGLGAAAGAVAGAATSAPPPSRVPATTGACLEDPADPGTDEAAFVALLRAAHQRLGAPAPRAPWLAPLPSALPPSWHIDAGSGDVPLGLIDRPDLQQQTVLTWSPGEGPLRIIGGSRSGRSSTVRLLAAGLAARFVPTQLHLYAVSGGLALAPLVALNHVGGVVGAEEIARLRRLLHLLRETRAATEVGAATAAPGIVVLLDDWDQLCRVGAPTKEIVEEIVETALDQQAHGVTVVAAGGPVLARDRLLRAARTIVLSGLDASDLTLVGVRPSSFGADPPPGRGVLAEDGSAVQLASLADEPPLPHQAHGPATQDGFPRPVIDLPRRWARPSPIDASRVPRRAVRSLPRAADDICLPLGVGHTGPVTWQPKRWGRHLLVGGSSGSGRTSTLLTLAQSLAEADGRTIIVTDDGHRFEGLGTLLDTRDAPALGAALRDQPGAAVLVDDADALTSSPVGTVLTEWVDRLETVSGLMVVTVRMHTLTTAFRGLVPALAARQTALLLDPSSRHDGDALGVRIEPPATRTAGRGVVIVRGRVEEIQVAHPDPLPRAASYSGTAGGPTDPAHRTPPEGRQIPAAQHSAKAVLPRSA